MKRETIQCIAMYIYPLICNPHIYIYLFVYILDIDAPSISTYGSYSRFSQSSPIADPLGVVALQTPMAGPLYLVACAVNSTLYDSSDFANFTPGLGLDWDAGALDRDGWCFLWFLSSGKLT